MQVGVGASGGFAVPFALDPTILLTSGGAVSPIRELARVEQIVTDSWRGVTSEGVTATYAPELTEVGDNSPTLGQPVVNTAKGHAFVPFSIEVGMDWASLQAELVRLLTDARDVLDSTQFLTGSGNDAPRGVLTALTTAQRIQTSGIGLFATSDVYAIKQAIPPRFAPRSSWVLNSATVDTIDQFTPERSLVNDERTQILGRSMREWSTMATGTATGTKLAVHGDWSQYLIADRIGSTVELVPHVMGAAGRPIGARGLYFYWRTGSDLLVPNALRYLEVR